VARTNELAKAELAMDDKSSAQSGLFTFLVEAEVVANPKKGETT
jgi:hypothetical protein